MDCNSSIADAIQICPCQEILLDSLERNCLDSVFNVLLPYLKLMVEMRIVVQVRVNLRLFPS